MTSGFSHFQAERYLSAAMGEPIDFPVVLDEVVEAARSALPPDVFNYIQGAAGLETTAEANREAFGRWRFQPRHLSKDLTDRDLSVELFGKRWSAPIGLAPVGVLGTFHERGELIAAETAAELGIPWVVPTLSSIAMEDIAEAIGDGPRLFQLYLQKDPLVTASFVKRAEAAGFDAIVLTIDTQLPSWRPRDLRGGYHPLLGGAGIANHLADPAFQGQRANRDDDTHVMYEAAALMGDETVTWQVVGELAASTSLPLLVKGVQHPADAATAIDRGVEGIVVSNHGGRQLDGAVGSLDVLPSIVTEVAGRVPVLFDSGIRCGADVVKALALGADAALIGRPYAFGLAAGGAVGLRSVIRGLLAEVEITVGLLGCTCVDELGTELLVPAS